MRNDSRSAITSPPVIMPFRKIAFLRGRSMSDETETSTEKIKEKKCHQRATTEPLPPIPIEELTRLALVSLPETHMVLFHKLIQKPATEFSRFAELPDALRERIWRELFPPAREIKLRVQYRGGEYDKSEFGFPPPVTYFVNKESRAETKKYYYFYSQEQVAFENMTTLMPNPHCYCINPSVDKVSVGFQSLWSHNYSHFLRSMLAELQAFRKQLRVLEVVDVFQLPFVVSSANEQEVKRFMAQNLTRFHYLDEVRFVLDRREDLESDFAIAWKERIIKAFQREKKKYPHCSMPKIVCISWKVKDAMKYLKFEHKA